jgi:hypothetical protein
MSFDISEIAEDFEGFNPVNTGWDCDPFQLFELEPDIDEEDAEGDWQTVVLDRFGDRLVTANY